MFKKSAFLLFMLLLLLGTRLAFASDFLSIYTVDADHSTTPKSDFKLDETPWLYLKLPEPMMSDPVLISFKVLFWLDQDPSVSDMEKFSTSDTSLREFWVTPSNWENIKQAGDWTVLAGFTYSYASGCDPDGGQGETTFTTPEPISASLFLLGGSALGLIAFRKRKILY